MPSTVYAATMLVAGIGIPLLAALNAGLGRAIQSPVAAAAILFAVALATTLALLLATTLASGENALPRALGAPRHLFLGGLLVVFYVVSVTAIAPRFGVGNAVFFVLLGQLISAAAIDHFGLFGARPAPLTLERAGGIALMAAGVALTQRSG